MTNTATRVIEIPYIITLVAQATYLHNFATRIMQHLPLISAFDLQQLLKQQNNILIIDCRFDLANTEAGAQQYAQSHIPGAFFLDLDKDLCAPKTGHNGRHPLPERETLAKRLRAIGMNNDTHVIVYDQADSMFAAHMWWLLLWLGHQQVQVLDGGLTAWTKAGGELTAENPSTPHQGNFAAQNTLTPTVDAQYLLRNLGTPSVYIVDARAQPRYKGEVEPMDPVAGHIPGAVNRPFMDNLQPDGTYKPANMLKEEWTAFLKNHDPQTVVHQCGSGVSACHNLLAMAQAGFAITTIYPGSWSEWCANPDYPTAKG